MHSKGRVTVIVHTEKNQESYTAFNSNIVESSLNIIRLPVSTLEEINHIISFNIVY